MMRYVCFMHVVSGLMLLQLCMKRAMSPVDRHIACSAVTDPNFLKRGEDNVSAPSLFIANAHNG